MRGGRLLTRQPRRVVLPASDQALPRALDGTLSPRRMEAQSRACAHATGASCEYAPISELSPSRYSTSVAGATPSSRELILPGIGDQRKTRRPFSASRGKKPTSSNKSSKLHSKMYKHALPINPLFIPHSSPVCLVSSWYTKIAPPSRVAPSRSIAESDGEYGGAASGHIRTPLLRPK